MSKERVMIVISVDELTALIESGVKNALRAMGWRGPTTTENASMDIDEACAFLKIAKGTMYKLTSNRKIPHRKVGRKLIFQRQELIKWSDEHKRSTSTEIDMAAANWVVTKNAA